uniref:RAD54 homolog B n=1 Tax=Ovis aries TaxID=9940 RepID=A0AC11AZ21_SHEEP
MRRSAAPSQLQGNPFKKPKFISPARSHPSPNEEVAKLNSDIKLFEVAANKNNFLQPQNDPRTCNFNLPTKECAKGINHGDSYREKYCLEASTKTTLDLHHTVQTWMRKHRLVPVHYSTNCIYALA